MSCAVPNFEQARAWTDAQGRPQAVAPATAQVVVQGRIDLLSKEQVSSFVMAQ
jgi:hypothetical protein